MMGTLLVTIRNKVFLIVFSFTILANDLRFMYSSEVGISKHSSVVFDAHSPNLFVLNVAIILVNEFVGID